MQATERPIASDVMDASLPNGFHFTNDISIIACNDIFQVSLQYPMLMVFRNLCGSCQTQDGEHTKIFEKTGGCLLGVD